MSSKLSLAISTHPIGVEKVRHRPSACSTFGRDNQAGAEIAWLALLFHYTLFIVIVN